MINQPLSKIGVRRSVNEEGHPTLAFDWQGESPYVGFSFDFWQEADENVLRLPPLSETVVGTEIMCGPFRLKVVAIDQSQEVVMCKRPE
jgi:hypothetical protein